MLAEAGAEDRKPPIDALRADAAMLAVARRLANPRAAERLSDEVRATAAGDELSHLALGFPEERILNLDVVLEDGREQPTEALENPGMCRSRRPRAKHMRGGREVQADDAILEEPNGLPPEQSCNDDPQGGEQEGSGPLGVFTSLPGVLVDDDRDVKELPRPGPQAHRIDESRLLGGHHRRGLMADQGNVLAVPTSSSTAPAKESRPPEKRMMSSGRKPHEYDGSPKSRYG
jgi:hypothetical protein